MTIIAILLIIIFLFLAGIHIYWGLGGQWGTDAVIPTRENNEKVLVPGVVSTFIVAIVLLCFGFIVLLNKIEIVSTFQCWMDTIKKYGLYAIASIFILRGIGEFQYVGLFKKYNHTKFGQNDTKYYSPLSLAIGILTIILELTK